MKLEIKFNRDLNFLFNSQSLLACSFFLIKKHLSGQLEIKISLVLSHEAWQLKVGSLF